MTIVSFPKDLRFYIHRPTKTNHITSRRANFIPKKTSPPPPPRKLSKTAIPLNSGNNSMLQFVHIPKTGGSAIVSAGSYYAKPPILWGKHLAEYFLNSYDLWPNYKHASFSALSQTNSLSIEPKQTCKCPLWHVPPSVLFKDKSYRTIIKKDFLEMSKTENMAIFFLIPCT